MNSEHVEVLRQMWQQCANDRRMIEADALDAAIASLSAPQPPAEAHCTTCSCVPGMTPAVRFDTTPAEKEGAVRDHLILMGWTPPADDFEGAAEAFALAQKPAPTLPDVDDDDLTVAYMAGRHDGRKEAQQPAADEKPVGWWNGILPDVTDRSPYDPSIRWGADAENSGHDIPLYAGVNPSRVQQTAAVDEPMVEAVRHRVGCHDGLDITPAQVRSVLKHWRIESLAAQPGGSDNDR